MTLRLLVKHPEIDGIFAANDMMALGAIAAIQERGRLVPDDILVVGFDDSVMAQTHRPGLTTVRQDILGLGSVAAEAMMELLQNRKAEHKFLPTELVIRESA
jgi:DNA-binding LacI/PurR family transcriptional regulator